MVKMIFFCNRKAAITHNQYASMVLDDHVPLALRHHPTMRRYVVNIVDHTPQGETEYDSVAELSFDTIEDYRRHLYDTPEGEEIIGRDVARFMGGAAAYVTTEHVHKELDRPAPLGARHDIVKMICPIRRREGTSHEEFVDHWLERHRPLALRHHPGLLRYVANVVDDYATPSAPPLDGIGELYFASFDSLRQEMFDSADGEEIIRRDIERFIGHTTGYIATEYVQKRA